MTDPIRSAAVNLYVRMSEHVEDIQMEASADTWLDGAAAWFSGIGSGTISRESIEAHEEKTCRAVLYELSLAFLRRANGQKPFDGEPL